MGTKVTTLCLCILTAFLACTDQNGSAHEVCSPNKFPLLTEVRAAVDVCFRSILSWNVEDKAQLLHVMAELSKMLKQDLVKGCYLPDGSPSVEVHSNGGIVCVTIKDKVYCKPMCDHGYDFNFLRRSRPYEVCSAGSWTTQFIGGNRLATCTKSTIQISALPSAYFPKDKDCRLHLDDTIIQQFITELRSQQITGVPTNTSLSCVGSIRYFPVGEVTNSSLPESKENS